MKRSKLSVHTSVGKYQNTLLRDRSHKQKNSYGICLHINIVQERMRGNIFIYVDMCLSMYFYEVLELAALISSDRNEANCCLGIVVLEIDSKSAQGASCGAGYPDVYICQNLLNSIL